MAHKRVTRQEQARRMVGRAPFIVLHGPGCCKYHVMCSLAQQSDDNMHTVFMFDGRHQWLINDAINTGYNIYQIMIELSIQQSIKREWPNT